MLIHCNQSVLDLFSECRIYFSTSVHSNRLKVGDGIHVAAGMELEKYSHVFAGYSMPRSIGSFSYTYSAFTTGTEIGRYCSIASGVKLMGDDHPAKWVSTSPFSYGGASLQGIAASLTDRGVEARRRLPFDKGKPVVSIGHDVWIGENVMLRRGIRIGHGAMIGTRALVTKDVEPYAIVGGVPARVIRYRFDERTIARLLAVNWWAYHFHDLQPFDPSDVNGFLDKLENAIALGQMRRFEPGALRFDQITAAAAR